MNRDLERNLERHRPLHLFDEEAADRFDLARRDLEEEFVVDLEHDRGGQPLGGESAPDAEHRQLDEIGGRPLNDRVHRRPLRKREAEHTGSRSAAGPVADLLDRPPAAEHRRDIPIAAAAVEAVVDEGLGTGEGAEVSRDECGGIGLRDAEGLGQPEGALAVENPEIDRLGRPAHLAGHAVGRQAEHRGGGARVDVLS